MCDIPEIGPVKGLRYLKMACSRESVFSLFYEKKNCFARHKHRLRNSVTLREYNKPRSHSYQVATVTNEIAYRVITFDSKSNVYICENLLSKIMVQGVY